MKPCFDRTGWYELYSLQTELNRFSYGFKKGSFQWACNRGREHCVEHTRIQVYCKPYFPVQAHNRRFRPYTSKYESEKTHILAYFTWWKVIKSNMHCVKSVRIQSYSGTHFPAFEMNMESYPVSLRMQSECRKMRTRITPNTDTFYAVMIWL